MEHRREFADKKLAAAFPPDLSYPLKKIGEAVSPSGDAKLGGISVDYITHINATDASIFAYFSQKQTKKLLEMAKELDEEYSQ